MRSCVHLPRCMFMRVFVDFCGVLVCFCSDIVQNTILDGSTELGNYEDDKKVGQHVYMERGMCVFVLCVYGYVCLCLCSCLSVIVGVCLSVGRGAMDLSKGKKVKRGRPW
jgi:hypothetical protein